MLRPLSLRWMVPLTLVVLSLPACSDTADDSADTTLASTTTTVEATTTTEAPTTTTTKAPTTTTTSTVPLPTYDEVVAAFPPGASPCTTRADISGGEGGSYDFAGGAILDNSVENPLFCFGAQYTVIGPTVLPDGTSVSAGSYLTIDGEGNLIAISGFG